MGGDVLEVKGRNAVEMDDVGRGEGRLGRAV